MPVFAVRLGCVVGASVLSAQDVLAVSHRFEVLRVAAPRDAAEVVELASLRDLPDEVLVGDAMNVPGHVSLIGHCSVPVAYRAVPQPAPVRVKDHAINKPVHHAAHLWTSLQNLHLTPFGVSAGHLRELGAGDADLDGLSVRETGAADTAAPSCVFTAIGSPAPNPRACTTLGGSG